MTSLIFENFYFDYYSYRSRLGFWLELGVKLRFRFRLFWLIYEMLLSINRLLFLKPLRPVAYISAFVLSLFSCVHSLGLGLDFGNSFDQREGESAHALIHRSQSFQRKSRWLILNDTHEICALKYMI